MATYTRLFFLCLLWICLPVMAEPFALSREFAETIQTLYQAGLVPLPADAQAASRILWRGSVLPRGVRGQLLFSSRWVWTDPNGETRLLIGNDIQPGTVQLVEKIFRQVPPPASQPDAYITTITDTAVERGLTFESFQKARSGNRLSARETLREDGHWLIVAIRLHETGFSELANSMAMALIEARGQEGIYGAARGALTEFAYDSALHRYIRHGDLLRFITEVEDLHQKEGSNWTDASVVELLLEEWRSARAAGQQVPETLRPEQQSLYRSLLEIPPGMAVGLGSVLVQNPLLLSTETAQQILRQRQAQLKGIPEENVLAEDMTSAEKLLTELIEAGPELIPVCIALLDSPVVLPISNQNIGTQRIIPAASPAEAQAFFRLRTFPQPLKVADLAHTILRSVVPKLASISGESLAGESQRLYEILRGKTRLEIAQEYMRGAGNYAQVPQSARNVLIEEGDEDLHDQIRAKILADPNPLSIADSFVNTLLMEGEKGEAFRLACIEKVLSIYAEQLADPTNPHRALIRSQIQQKLGWDPPAETETPR